MEACFDFGTRGDADFKFVGEVALVVTCVDLDIRVFVDQDGVEVAETGGVEVRKGVVEVGFGRPSKDIFTHAYILKLGESDGGHPGPIQSTVVDSKIRSTG